MNIPPNENALESSAKLVLIWCTLGELWPFPLTRPGVCELCSRCSCRETWSKNTSRLDEASVGYRRRRKGSNIPPYPPRLCPLLHAQITTAFFLNAIQKHKHPKELQEMPLPLSLILSLLLLLLLLGILYNSSGLIPSELFITQGANQF